jgi:hypothetical protein
MPLFLFADDTNIYYESKSLIDIEKTVNRELKLLSQWLNVNRLALNVTKTNFVIFRSTKRPLYHNVVLIMNRKAIEQKEHVKYLGILMDEHLLWKPQISTISKKISRGTGILAKLKGHMDKSLLVNIYYSLVFSHLSYGVEAWGSACDSYISHLEVIQNKAVRVISGVQYYQIYGEDPVPLPSSTPLYKELKILKLADIFKFTIAKFIYQTLCNESPNVFSDWFIYTHMVHDHATRSSIFITQENYFDIGTLNDTYTLYINKGNLQNYGKKLVRVSGPLIWNNIPYEIQDSTSIQTFKCSFKDYFIQNY